VEARATPTVNTVGGLSDPIARVGADGPAPKGPVRDVLAEAHPGMRSSLSTLLNHEPDMHVIADAADADSAIHLLVARPDVLILDYKIAGKPSEARFRALMATNATADSRIVITTTEDSRQLALHALDAGATAVVLKDKAPTDLAQAIRSAAQGHRYISPDIR